MDSLVSTQWLAERLQDDDIAIVDCSWHMPASGRSGGDEYRSAHIPGARFFDIDALADTLNPAPHMLPAADDFSDAMEALGISRDARIVVYDNSPLRTAARGWFMLRHFGAAKVAVLDGGLGKWLAEGRPTESGEPPARRASFRAEERADVVAQADIPGNEIVDARGKPRFEGAEAEPRPNVAAGHIPGSRNLPYAALYNDDGTLRPPNELAALFTEAGTDPQVPFVATCGSGVTASSLIFAAHLLGNAQARLYDGSWSEWGADPATPKALGPA